MRIGSLIVHLLLLTAAAFSEGTAVHAAGPDDETAHARVRIAAETLLQDRYPEFAPRLTVRVLRLRAAVTSGDSVSVRLSASDGVPRGHTQVRVVHESPDGRADAGWAVLYIAHYDSVLVAHRDIRAGDPVAVYDLAKAWVDVTKFRGQPLGPSVQQSISQGHSLLAARPIGAGDVLRSGDLRPPYAAQTGDSVTMTYRRGAVVLKLTCRAREPGAAGDVIRVYSDATKETYKARLGPDGTASWVATL